MEMKLLASVIVLLCVIENIYSCPVWAGPHKSIQGVAPQILREHGGEEQWPLASWSDPAVHQSRVRRRDPLVPLNLEEFRRENLSPKPVWRDPNLQNDNSHLQKQASNNIDE